MEEPLAPANQKVKEAEELKNQSAVATPVEQSRNSADGNQADDEDPDHKQASLEQPKVKDQGPREEKQVAQEMHWEASYEDGEFHLDEVHRYNSLEEVNRAIEQETKKLHELDKHQQQSQAPVPDQPQASNDAKAEKQSIEEIIPLNEQIPVESTYAPKADPHESPLEQENQENPPAKEMSAKSLSKHSEPQREVSEPTEYLYKPAVDPFMQSKETVKSVFIEESQFNQLLRQSKDLQEKNSELQRRCSDKEKENAELKAKLAQIELKQKQSESSQIDDQEPQSPDETEAKQPIASQVAPSTMRKKKKITDDGLKQILHAMASIDRGKPVTVQLPKRNKQTRKGPLFSRDFKLSSNIYNIAFGEIMDLGHPQPQPKQQEQEEQAKPFRKTMPEINVCSPQRREHELTHSDLQQVTLEHLEQKRFQLENQLQQINDHFRINDDQRSGKFNTVRYEDSATDWKDNHKFGTEIEEQPHSNYHSNNPNNIYWHSVGKKANLHLERSEMGIRYKHTMEDRQDNPELYPKRTSARHRSRPTSKKRSSGEFGNPKEALRELKDRNQQDNEDKAIQTPEIILSPGFKVTLKDLIFPMLPGKPENYHTPKQLSELARKTFLALNVPIDESHSLLVKKFKNCVWFKVFDMNIVWYYEGKFYVGGWKESGFANEGEKEGYGIELIPNKYLYEGNFVQGRRHGQGKIKYENGDYYEGEWNNGVKEGNGKLIEANGITYEGYMKDGRRDGFGKLTLSPVEIYEGGFVRGIKNGRGKETFKTGDSYEGDYVLGKFSGEGCYKWANGAMYLGQFHNGCRSGKGYWRSSQTTPCDTYEGEYQNDKKCGKGIYTWETGVSYDGDFMNDLRQGEGTVRYPNGKVIRAMWENGVRKQELYSQEKEMYKQARKRAESASAKTSLLPKVS